MNQNFEFSVYFQRSVLARVLKDSIFAIECLPILDAIYFDTHALKWVCNKLKSNIKTIPILIEELKKEKNLDLKKAVAEEIKVMVNKTNFDEAQFGFDKIRQFVGSQKLSDGILKAALDIKDGKLIGDVKDQLNHVLGDLYETNNRVKTVNLFQGYQDRIKYREDRAASGQAIFIPTGIKAIDDDIGGPMPGQFWSFFADTKMGKSSFACNCGRCESIYGFPAWHVVIEDELEMTEQRYDAAFSTVAYRLLTTCGYTKDQKDKLEKIFELLNKKRKNCLYLTKIEEGCNMADVEDEYKRIQIKHNFKPIVILLDSPHCMESVLRKDTMREKYKQIYVEIRKFVRRERVAVIAFDQANQEARGKVGDKGAVSESYDKVRIVDGMITINQTRMQKKDNILQLYVAAMKDREEGKSYYVRPNRSIIRFDSIEGNFEY